MVLFIPHGLDTVYIARFLSTLARIDGFYGVVSAVVFQGIYCYRDLYQIIERRQLLPTSPRPMSLVAEEGTMAAESRALVPVTVS